MTSDLAAVVLAGGEGRRMGGDKPLRLLKGRPLIDWALDFALQRAPSVAVSVRRTGQAGQGLRAPELPDPLDVEGPMAGLSAALTFAGQVGARRLLLLPCDAPYLPRDLADRLGEALEGAPGSRAALAVSGDRLHPACSLWEASCVGEIGAYLATGRSSLRGFAEQVGCVTAAWPDPAAFANLNTPQDLAQAQAAVTSCGTPAATRRFR